jgi:hypothetical protein
VCEERGWDEDEPAQCLSRPVGSVIPLVVVCIQSGHIFHPVTGATVYPRLLALCLGAYTNF